MSEKAIRFLGMEVTARDRPDGCDSGVLFNKEVDLDERLRGALASYRGWSRGHHRI